MGRACPSVTMGFMLGQLVTLTASYAGHPAGAKGSVLEVFPRADGDRAIVSFRGDLQLIPVGLLAQAAATPGSRTTRHGLGTTALGR